MTFRSLIFLLSFFLSSATHAQFGSSEKSTFKVFPSVTAIAPGETFRVAIQLEHPEHWHSYFENPGILGVAPMVKWDLPEGFTPSETMFPIPRAIETKSGGLDVVLYGYEGKVNFIYEITAPENLESGQSVNISGMAEWQICNEDSCVPESAGFSFSIGTAAATQLDPSNAPIFANTSLPKSAENWSFEVEEDAGSFVLTATAPDGITPKLPVYFFSTDKQVDSQSLQDAEIDGQTITAYFDRNKGNEKLYIEPGPVLETLSGMLVYHTDQGKAAVNLKTSLSADPVAADPPSVADLPKPAVHLGTRQASAEEIAAGAELYDTEAKLDIVSLSGVKEKEVTFASSLALVFIGGLLLNLMPCVFPVLGLKVMSFVSQAGEDEKKIKVHGMVFTLGLLVTMWILSTIIISLNLNWGEQLSNPIFLGSIIILLFAMGLNLFGLFEIGTSMTSVGGDLQAKKGYSGSFFSGVLTTLIATPCSGPFLGAVMGFALSHESKTVAFAIFTVFAFGIASPYLLLSFFPALIKKLPRPGAWMESFKQIMAFLVFATVVFFLKSYLKLVGDEHFIYFLFALVLIGMGAYIYGRWGTPNVKQSKRLITGFGVAGVMMIGGLTWAYSVSKKPKPGLAWQEWYPGVIEVNRPKKRIVWVDYTADW